MDILKAIILAVVQGISEFLPVSSTGHLILVEEYLEMGEGAAFTNAFIVIIQLPAILSVIAYFWRDMLPLHSADALRASLRLWSLIVVAFLPIGVVGFIFGDFIEARLMNWLVVACTLVLGGVVLIVVEMLKPKTRLESVHDIGYATAFFIGCFQCLALVPGTSRSAATIIGGMALGASRPAAAEFSFFLAVPTLLGATVLTLYKDGLGFTGEQWTLLAVGCLVSFLTAYLSIAFLMAFVKRHSFIPFGVYRIILGGVVLLYFLLNH